MRSSLLHRALGANALFSAASGTACLLFGASIAPVIGNIDPWILRLLGAALLLFAAFLFRLTRQSSLNPTASLFATLADLGWVLGSLVLLLLPSDAVSAAGSGIIAGVAAVVLLLALLQITGLRARTLNRDGRTAARSAFEIRTPVSAPADAIWDLVRDLEAIGRFHPVLQRVDVTEATSGDVSTREGFTREGSTREGARRTCETHRGQRWTEEVIAWDNSERAMTLAFDVEAPDFPFPMTEMYGGWKVEATGADATGVDATGDPAEVVVWFEFTVRGGVFGDILAPVIAHQSASGLEAAIANMDAEATRTTDVGVTRTTDVGATR